MKKSIILSMVVGAGLLFACDPVEDRTGMGGAITADQLKLSATPIVRDGVNSNYIVLNSDGNACLTSWDYGFGTTIKTVDTVKVMLRGNNEITFTGLNADGSYITKTLTVVVDKLYDVEPEWELFCGADGERTWAWDVESGGVWGNGPFIVGSIAGGGWGPWFSVMPDEITDQASSYSFKESDDSGDATMKFCLKGAKIVKSNGKTGTFSFDMSKTINNPDGELWSIGKLFTTGSSVLFPVQINTGTKIYDFDILTLTNDHMLLTHTSATVTNQWGESTFWKFKALD